ncbi:MAG: TauD/TfdA family dioxygenase [Chromatiales bacterium]|jgi:hypothetical protein|nr:TauD/TfdA family dioxygenase [Chromatiales bacterium]
MNKPIDDASAWWGLDMIDATCWIRHFSTGERAELKAAVSATIHQGLGPFEFDADHFALPTLASALQRIRHDVDHGRGFVMLRGIEPNEFNEAELRVLYAGICTHLGYPITQNRVGARLVDVKDHGTDYASRNTRGHTSNGEILPHCDSADVVGLMCVRPASKGGESQIASAATVYNLMLKEHPEYLAPLTEGFQINLAGKGPSGLADECSRNTIPVFSYFAGRLSCRFNAKQIIDGARIVGRTLTPLELAAIDYVGETALRDDVRLDMEFLPGDIQLLSNHSILHARGAFNDASQGAGRLLLRVWLNTPGSRPLDERFADRLNTGPRGEVAVAGASAP